ncbi:MAG TPA: cell division protein ZapE [Rickettsiales bacterium]|nr:cell division protein ZapE [Rickettsiales bacterium]
MTPPAASLIKLYEQSIQDARITADPAQRKVMEQLQTLAATLHTPPKKRGLIGKLLPASKPEAAPGIYIWGEVGRGKSMLMDMFFSAVKLSAKQRIHFHSLMISIHQSIHNLRKQHVENPVKIAAAEIAAKTRLLCLDEFQVTDVADAMILKKLFSALLEAGVTVVITSNRPPEELYQGGLQREKFLDFVKLVRERMEILELSSAHDYRMQKIKALKSVYLTPLNRETESELQRIYTSLSNGMPSEEAVLEVQGRKVVVAQSAGKVASFTFEELCAKPLGAADYLAIAHHFDTVFLHDIPLLSPEKRNEARRFVTLIDALYDTRTKLICTAAATPDKLYPSGDGSFEFQRTASRLFEMQSSSYLGEHYKL